MFCSKCGRQLRDDDNFCAVCGAPVDPGAKPERPEPATPPTQPERGTGKTAKNDPGIPTSVVAFIVAGAVLATLLLIAVLRGGGDSAPSSSSSYSASASTSLITISSSSSGSGASSSSSSSSSSKAKSSSSSASITSQPSPASGLGNVSPVQTPDGRLPEDARKVAVAAGKEIFSGTLKMTTFAKRASAVTPKLQGFEGDDSPIALLTVDSSSSTGEAVHAGDPNGKPTTGSIETISISVSTPELEKFWKQLDGQKVTVASYPTELWWPSDVSGALYSVAGPCELLAYSG